MPIQNYSSFQRMTSFCRTAVPSNVWESISPISDDDEAVKAYGVSLAVSMCVDLMAQGVKGFHFYTLNLENSVLNILKKLHIEDTTASRRYVLCCASCCISCIYACVYVCMLGICWVNTCPTILQMYAWEM
jgi:hypothetical protein